MFRAILARATKVVFVSPGGMPSGRCRRGTNGWSIAPRACLRSGMDGTSGGTANCVEYARTRQVKIVNLWTAWERYALAPQPRTWTRFYLGLTVRR